jgi:4-hydroxy-tetrahydrodipicolinate synthase
MRNLHEHLSGVFTALVSPFDEKGNLDSEAFDSLVQHQIDAGVSGLVPVGTTGEAATLSEQERKHIIQRTVELSAGRAFVLAGTGSNDTAKAVMWTQKAEELGADGCLVVTPYYNKPSQKGLLMYFGSIAASTGLPIILYSVPGRCAVEIAPETAAELFDKHDNIVGIKEAGGSVERVTALRKACGKDFIIHSGDDALTLPFMASGAIGVTSVVSNLMPELMVELVDAWNKGDSSAALDIHDRVCEVAAAMFIEGSPVPVKTALAIRGRMLDKVRSPLAPLSIESTRYVREILEAN